MSTTENTPETAASPTREGLTFQRRNTIFGTDPYAQFTWSSRDVVMRNWRDGSVNFAQHGVEFPTHWSDNAVAIVTSKYFRGALGSERRESSLREVIDRVVGTYRHEGLVAGYFASEMDADNFADEMRYALVDQQFSFNSPVWFNVGTASAPQISACFILAVDDSMDSILNWYTEEGMIFKGGSGAGVNLSGIRSSKELLSSGGTASGPVSFMRGADASAGTIKSGGATRRAAKMVILDVDHPDIREFVRTKADEERKIRVLRDAGFDMDLGGKDIISVQYQNANNSVRVTDEFMNAVVTDTDFGLRARSTGEVIDTVRARELFREIAQAAWECADPGVQYDDVIQAWHTLPNTGRISASNPCAEFLHLDNSSCNLASVRLTKFYDPASQRFDIDGFRYLVRLITVAAEISVSFGHFPTPKIEETTRSARPLGLGFTDLGAMLMSAGVGYDSDLGRSWAAGITSMLAAEAYKTSAELASVMGPFAYFEANRRPMINVVAAHRTAAKAAADEASKLTTAENTLSKLHTTALMNWTTALEEGNRCGYRNSQVVVIAPTGTISFFMDAKTTGIEPDLGLVKFKKISDGSSIMIVNDTVPVALRTLGYSDKAIEEITAYVVANGSILGAPGFDASDAPVFACAMGDNIVAPRGHLQMMAAVQPFVSGSISKTVNLPEDATVEEIEQIYLDGWKMGLKCVALYRDNCKVGQPLSVVNKESKLAAQEAADAKVASAPTASASPVVKQTNAPAEKPAPSRVRLDRQRHALTTSFQVGGADGYMTAGTYADGQLGELFLKMSKPGSTLAGVMDAFAISVSLGLQYGVPLEVYVSKFLNTRFEPAGMTNDPELRMASSVLDYVFRRLAVDHLSDEAREMLGVRTTAERTAALSDYTSTSPVTDAVAASHMSDTYGDDAEHAVSEPAQPGAFKLTPATSVSAEDLRKALVADAPLCTDCGIPMRRAGSCYACEQCSATTGCS
jgi:ribonucleoside-diphosphate reductase alpha chain